jgi:CubicO group peptidase (beta-lactamase class C family)
MAQSLTDRIDTLIHRAVDTEAIPGAIVLVRQRGHVLHHSAYGVNDRAGKAPLHPDSVMWLASLTKPMVAAAILMLWEEGRLQLHDPLSRFISSFSQPRMVRVWRTPEGAAKGALPAVAPAPGAAPQDPPHDLVPASRELTLFDLLTHTSGLQTITIPNSKVPPTGPTDTLASRVPTLGAVPLDFQPGTRWAYSNAVGYDVLAYIVERVSGLGIADFLQQRLFAPLGMNDTGFGMLGKHARVVPVDPRFAASPAMAGEPYHSGAAGLWGSAADYATFAEMLRNGGQHNSVRILSSRSVEQMTCNQVGDLFPGLNGRRGAAGFGFGLGVAVVLDAQRAGTGLTAGSFGWDGVGTRRFWTSPETGLVLVMYLPDMKLQAELENLCADLTRT